MTTKTPLPPAVLRRLADIRSEPKGVLSVYLDLDPTLFPTPTDRESEITDLVRTAEREFAEADVDHEETRKRVAAIELLRDTLNDDDLVKDGRRGVAVFVAPSVDVFEVVKLDEPAPAAVVVDDAAYLRPIAEHAGPQTWAVLLIDRSRTRLLYGGVRKLVEIVNDQDNTPQHSKPGGWSDARYQRHSDDAARDHLAKAMDSLLRFYKAVQFDGLVIAAPDPMYNEAVDALPNDLRDRFHGRVYTEVGFPTVASVLEVAKPVFEEARGKAIEGLLVALDEAARENVAIGADATLAALSDMRVGTLILRDDYELSGARCEECGWIGLRHEACPRDGRPTVKRDDVVEEAVELALLQSARVVHVPSDFERQPPEPMDAILRF
jgi:peptide chain release factor subunit 1